MLTQKFSKIQQNINLAEYTTFKIGGPAKYFYVAEDKDDLIEVLNFCLENKIPYFILGGGSNILISDQGFGGLVIKIINNNLKIINQDEKSKIIQAGAGDKLANVVGLALQNELSGLENFIGIPGTIGGAVRGNAGAYLKSISDVLKSVTVLRLENGDWQIQKLTPKECNFEYRQSIFKANQDIIWQVELELISGNKEEILAKMKEYILKRQQVQSPTWLSAGCVFINPSVQNIDLLVLEDQGYDVARFKETGKIPAGWLIEQLNLKGKTIGQAQVTYEHANFIINLGQATADDVLKLIKFVQEQVKNKFKINLELEIELVGF
ncbi:MAG: UDP-N-acetylmuramate dehydrogenase [Patescibacteria group bacterium]|nr:UDP-N-acetylmuramate dehydrogenase [Patescibacteria group bacterium]